MVIKQLNVNQVIKVKEYELHYADTFQSVKPNESFWYCNANGLLEISVREASATERFQLSVGDKFNII